MECNFTSNEAFNTISCMPVHKIKLINIGLGNSSSKQVESGSRWLLFTCPGPILGTLDGWEDTKFMVGSIRGDIFIKDL